MRVTGSFRNMRCMVVLRSLPAALARAAWPSVVLALATLLDQSTRRPPLTSLLMTAFG